MSDFTSGFWSIYHRRHHAASASSACLRAAVDRSAQARSMPRGDNTTGHVWDEDLTRD